MTRLTTAFALMFLLPCIARADEEKKGDEQKAIEAVRFDGKLLCATPPEKNRAKLEHDLNVAFAELAEHPDDPDRLIWVGRRLGYLWRMNEAIEVFSQGVERYPDDPRFLRHRGHRYISLRQFDKAIADLERAAKMVEGKPDEVEPDGQPNDQGVFLTTLQFNIWYHLGLARYLNGDDAGAVDAFKNALRASRNYDDNIVACNFWLYLAFRKLEKKDQADQVLYFVKSGMKIIENRSYYLVLLMYKGPTNPTELMNTPESRKNDPSLGYGVGMWFLINDKRPEGETFLRHVLDGESWPSFGYIAAEMELAALQQSPDPTPVHTPEGG